MLNVINYRIFSKLISFFPPELLHYFFLQTLKLNFFQKKKKYENLYTKVLGKDFDNPIGLAAGFDKNAEVINGSFNLSFGFVEVGTVTPMPQKGNLSQEFLKFLSLRPLFKDLVLTMLELRFF